jgi:hypothetical protein
MQYCILSAHECVNMQLCQSQDGVGGLWTLGPLRLEPETVSGGCWHHRVEHFDPLLGHKNVYLAMTGVSKFCIAKWGLIQDNLSENKVSNIKMRKYADLHGDKRTFLGTVAGVVVTDNVKKYALKQGFFLIEPSGETFKIISPTGQPKEW